jgi:hypothetical protein
MTVYFHPLGWVKNRENKCGKKMEKLETLCILGDCKMVQPLRKTVWQFLCQKYNYQAGADL